MNPFDSLTDATVVFFLANTLYVISYTLTSMIWLRVLAIVASVSTLPYFYFQSEPLWSAIFWQTAYFIVNTVNLVILLYARRKRKFNDAETLIHEKFFADLASHEVAPIFEAAEARDVEADQTVLKAGESNSSLLLLVHGSCNVTIEEKVLATLEQGRFVGEMSFISGQPVSANIVTTEDCLFYVWNAENLQKLFSKQTLYKPYFYSLFSKDMAEKIRFMTDQAKAA